MTNDEREDIRRPVITERALDEVFDHAKEDLNAFAAVLANPAGNTVEWWRLPSWLKQDLRDLENMQVGERYEDVEALITDFIEKFEQMRKSLSDLRTRLDDHV